MLGYKGDADPLLRQITTALQTAQWNQRMSLLTHRYLREYGIDREDEIVEKAFRTLELFCVGEEAKMSLEVSGKTRLLLGRLSPSTTQFEEPKRIWTSMTAWRTPAVHLLPVFVIRA